MELAGAASHSPLLAAVVAADGASDASTPSETRVRGIELADATCTWSSTFPSAETHWASAYSYGELAADRQEVTNLRLPGQYDERLFAQAGISGLQGPYYNWNRWYLPSLGRYMELDPLALEGESNGDWAPDWYGYASNNPVVRSDQFGLFSKDKTCVNLPSEDDVAKAAEQVTDPTLKLCILVQNVTAHMRCPDKPDPGCCDTNALNYACAPLCPPGKQPSPGGQVTWCNRAGDKCKADVAVHEFAHLCGWNHRGDKGVPGNSGYMPCN